MGRQLIFMMVLQAALGGCALNERPTLSAAGMSELWIEPVDLESRDLFYGPGGPDLVPNPNREYALLEVDRTGYSLGYDVKDDRGQRWSVKLGLEARTEVVVSRLVWAVGYHQPDIYYVPQWSLTESGAVRPQPPARFRLEPSTRTKVGSWSWRNNPFVDTRPFAGLFVLMVMVNNWDVKTPQNQHECQSSALARCRRLVRGAREWFELCTLRWAWR
jgi:hypothetical protein